VVRHDGDSGGGVASGGALVAKDLLEDAAQSMPL